MLANSTVCYMIFNFLNLNAGCTGWTAPTCPRPWRAPTVLIGAGAVLAFVNALVLGWGANVWGEGALLTRVAFAALFCYRHYVQDRGVFPASMYSDLALPADGSVATPVKRAGKLPYMVRAGGVPMVLVGQWTATAG